MATRDICVKLVRSFREGYTAFCKTEQPAAVMLTLCRKHRQSPRCKTKLKAVVWKDLRRLVVDASKLLLAPTAVGA